VRCACAMRFAGPACHKAKSLIGGDRQHLSRVPAPFPAVLPSHSRGGSADRPGRPLGWSGPERTPAGSSSMARYGTCSTTQSIPTRVRCSARSPNLAARRRCTQFPASRLILRTCHRAPPSIRVAATRWRNARTRPRRRHASALTGQHAAGTPRRRPRRGHMTAPVLARISQCAPTARFTSGGRIHPGSCR
jgi:hypothetical protein